MEDVNAIYRIFKNLKYEMDNNGWVYQWHLGDEEPIKVTHKFYPPVSSEEFQLFEKHFPNMKLPAPDTDRFNLPFNEWLERYIVCQGHELWFFLNP